MARKDYVLSLPAWRQSSQYNSQELSDCQIFWQGMPSFVTDLVRPAAKAGRIGTRNLRGVHYGAGEPVRRDRRRRRQRGAVCGDFGAREGASVLLLERAPKDERGGNSSYTEGLMRFVYDGSDDILALSPDLTEEERKSDFGSYTEDKFFDDMARITQNRTDPDLCELLVRGSNQAMHWMQAGVCASCRSSDDSRSRSTASYTFWGGATLAAGAAGPVSSTRCTRRPRKPASASSMTPGCANWPPFRRRRRTASWPRSVRDARR